MHQTKRLSVLGIVVTILGAILVLLNSRVPSVVHAQSNTYQTTVYASYRFHTLKNPTGLAYVPYDWSGVGHPYLIVVDTGNNLIRTFDMPAGTLSTRAGSGTAGYLNGGYLYAEFDKPTGIDVVNTSWRDSNNKYHYYTIYYVGDTNNYVVRYFCTGDSGTSNPLCPSPIGSVATYAGNHAKGYVNGTPPTAEFAHLGGMRKGLGYGVDTDNHAVRGLGTSITTFAGTGSAGFVNGYRTSAKFNTPTQITRDGSSNLYVADAGNHVVRKIDVSGNVTTFSGSGTSGYQDGAPSVARFVWPTSIVFNSADNYFYVADPINNAIRRIDRSGNVSTYSGAPTAGYVDGTLAQARYSSPTDLIIVNGFMYISDSTNNAIRRIDMVNGIVSTYIN